MDKIEERKNWMHDRIFPPLIYPSSLSTDFPQKRCWSQPSEQRFNSRACIYVPSTSTYIFFPLPPPLFPSRRTRQRWRLIRIWKSCEHIDRPTFDSRRAEEREENRGGGGERSPRGESRRLMPTLSYSRTRVCFTAFGQIYRGLRMARFDYVRDGRPPSWCFVLSPGRRKDLSQWRPVSRATV